LVGHWWKREDAGKGLKGKSTLEGELLEMPGTVCDPIAALMQMEERAKTEFRNKRSRCGGESQLPEKQKGVVLARCGHPLRFGNWPPAREKVRSYGVDREFLTSSKLRIIVRERFPVKKQEYGGQGSGQLSTKSKNLFFRRKKGTY